MDLSKLRIGYVPYNSALNQPGDRRRFCYYAKKRNVNFEIARPSEYYDVVIVTERGDLGVWSTYRKGDAKVVYDFIDSYFAVPRHDIKGLLRGLAKYIAKENRFLRLDYWKAIEDMCGRSDAVICTTEEQKEDITRFCGNVHIILDFHGDTVRNVKQNYSAGDVFNFVWEGLPHNIDSLYEIKDVLERLKGKHKIALNIVTDLEYYRYMGRYGRKSTTSLTRGLFDNAQLYEWNEKTCSSIITNCDMALIPVSLGDPFAYGKPENKLLLFWRMGMPAVVSATPAYSRAMQRCGLPMACRTKGEWLETLEKYINDKEARRQAGERGRAFADDLYSEENILARWDRVFTSINI